MSNTKDEQSIRVQQVWEEIENLYSQSKRRETSYLWEKHVQVVADYASGLSDRYKGNKDLCVVGALLHDIADVWMEREDDAFEVKTRDVIEEVLQDSGFSALEIIDVKDNIIDPHSCHLDNLPTSLEGKVLATADALAHLNTNFYEEVYGVFFSERMSESEYREWVIKKIDRDYKSKILFEKVRKDARGKYNMLKSKYS